MRVRCCDPRFLEKVRAYYKRLIPEFLPYLSTNGGSIIAVCIENEYGSYALDLDYLKFLADELRAGGVDVPLYQTDCTEAGIRFTRPLGVWQATNYRIESEYAIPKLREIQPDKPPFVGEYWSGRSVYWGESGAPREVAPIAKAYRTALELGAYVSFYMFAGGTNFGFMNGTRVTKPFDGSGEAKLRAITTSYQCDALIAEDGCTTEKYYACRRELDEYLKKPIRSERIPDPEFQELCCELCEAAPLFGNIDRISSLTESAMPLTFEELDFPYGFVLYSAMLPSGWDKELSLGFSDIRDRALIFIDGEYKGTILRDHPMPCIKCRADIPHRLDIIVENLGRANLAPHFPEEKGLIGDVTFGGTRVCGWECRPIELDRLSELDFLSIDEKISVHEPIFLRGSFKAVPGVASHLDMHGFGKGVVFINGFNLGRFWEIGPQQTLYVPGGLLREENEIVIFELDGKRGARVEFIGSAILDEYHPELC